MDAKQKPTITTSNGLLFMNGRELALPEADFVARQYGHQWAEQMVRALEREKKENMDSSNQFVVAVQGDKIVILRQPVGQLRREEAINLAAWLAVLADPDGKQFQALVEEVKRT